MTETRAAKQPQRIALFGGSFNPPHEGHVACVRIALDEFGHLFDRLLVVPAAEPYYKDVSAVSAEGRLGLCRAAFADFLGAEVSDLDIARGGTTYTVDTLQDVRRLYGEDAEVYFILGSDSYASLPRWKDAGVLAEGMTFIVIPRVSGEVDAYWQRGAEGVAQAEGASLVAHESFKTLFAAQAAPAMSSTALREALARGESVVGCVPEEVLWYIHTRNLYDWKAPMTELMDPFSEDFLEARKAELAFRVGEHRLKHILGVAETAQSLARTYSVDEKEAYLAGLLHDWDKNFDDEGIRARANELGMTFSDEVFYGAAQTLHGMTAAVALGREFPQIPASVLQAVSRHTTGHVAMSALDMVVYIADALEPGRHFAGLQELREKIGKLSLEDLFIEVQAYWISLIVMRKKTLHPCTFDVWNTYARRFEARRVASGLPHKGDWTLKPHEALD